MRTFYLIIRVKRRSNFCMAMNVPLHFSYLQTLTVSPAAGTRVVLSSVRRAPVC